MEAILLEKPVKLTGKKKLIIFDYDGVIVDSFPAQYEVYKIILKRFNCPVPATIEEFSVKFMEGYKEFRKKSGIVSEEDNALATKIYYDEVIKHVPPLFPGIKEVLESLHQKYHMVLISKNRFDNVLDKLSFHKVDGFFSHLVGSNHESNSVLGKASEINKILEKLKVSPKDCIMIGDRYIDYKEAKDCGVNKIILVNYGWGFLKEKTPDRVKFEVNAPKDILAAIKSIGF